ncbi:rRNA maturation RNase YbeY [Aliiroseovarius marinus]|uniref:rRNA maturation RNase YbeY n=1 Tax=Aliiroseovarius marinus TaxID=2500159 RepID=UPI003D7E7B5C
MSVDIVFEDPRWEGVGLAAIAEAAFDEVQARFGLAGSEVAVLACDDARIAELNGDFREKPQPTNVLSWPSQERGAQVPGGTPLAPDDLELGDIAIAYETCLREAEAQAKPISDHVTHLMVHGLLHLLGYDHINDKDAGLMEGLEVEILGKMGISNPYEE